MKCDCDYSNVVKQLGDIKAELNFPIGQKTRYKTGGNCSLAIFPKSEIEFRQAVETLKGVCPYETIGQGSNLLVSDDGFDGAVILTDFMLDTRQSGNLYIAESGVKLSAVIKDMALNSLGGLEFAVGIPASVGGAVCMNAGAYGKTVGEFVRYVVTSEGTFSKKDCRFGYRTSRFLEDKTPIIKVCFSFNPTEPDISEEKIKNYTNMRRNPKGKNCGSVFRNEGYFAGRVIDECNLKGKRIGGARVSVEHANFIIADDSACSQDIYRLINLVKEEVYLKKQIKLTEELTYLGKF